MKFFDFNQLIRMALTCNKYIHLKGLKSSGGYQLKQTVNKSLPYKIPRFRIIWNYHITYRDMYIYPSRHNFENCLLHDFSPQSCLGRLLPAGPAQAAF